MTRCLSILGFLFLFALNSIGQDSFLSFQFGLSGYYVTESNNNYIVAGQQSEVTFDNSIAFSNNDSEGQVLSEYEFEIDTVVSTDIRTRSICPNTNGGHHVAATLVLNDGSLFGVYFRFNEDFTDTTFSSSPFEIGLSTVFGYALELSEDSILILGTFQEVLFLTKTLVLCMDSTGNVLWQNEIDTEGADIYPSDVEQLSDGGYLITCSDHKFGFPDREPHSHIFKTDPLGNVEWSIKPGNWLTHYTTPGGTVLHEDDSFTTFWTENYSIQPPGMGIDQPDQTHNIFYANYDSNGLLINEGNYDDFLELGIVGEQGYWYFPYHVTPWPDGNIMISGNNFRAGLLLKVSSTGEYLWHREYSPIENLTTYLPSTRTHLYGVYPASDGSILAAGEFRSNPGDLYPQGIQTSILLKVDSMGCLDTMDCELIPDGLWEPGSSATLGVLQVYPNPTTGVLRVEIDSGLGVLPSGLRLELFDHYGNMVLLMSNVDNRISNDEVELDLSELAVGLYHIRLIAEDAMWHGRVMRE